MLRTPRGGGSGRIAAVLALLVLAVWAASGIYRVQPDEEGVVLRFGAYNRNAPPGLNYHIPWPVETALTPRVTTENLVFIGFRSADASAPRAGAGRDVREESLMLTGDENIIDIDFVVRWRVRDASEFLFNTRNPESTIKSAAESMMREVIGRTPIQPALTEARAQIETQVAQGTQAILDQYKAGVVVTQVQLQKVDPPAEVIEAFRDVQRAAADKERSRNEAEAYRNDIIPRARGEAERMMQEAQGFRDSQEARAKGEATRFISVLGAYRQAQDITMRRLYLETMEEILRRNPKVIVDDRLQGLVPFLNLSDPAARGAGNRPAAPSAQALPAMPRSAQPQGGTR
jgi:membrane protease subunit HflK